MFILVAEKATGPASYFSSIEKNYGQPMDFWLDQLKQVADKNIWSRLHF